MRNRKKPWVKKELASCSFFVPQPKENKGHWAESFSKIQPLHIEIGCGKGGFISKLGVKCPDTNYIAIDLISDMIGRTARKINASYSAKGKDISNLLITCFNAQQIPLILDKTDSVSRIYLNFSNPWPKPKHYKRRLTHTRQLESYKSFLNTSGEIHFKTDDDMLYRHSLGYFAEAGYTILETYEDITGIVVVDSAVTEHEAMFVSEGKPIKYIKAKL